MALLALRAHRLKLLAAISESDPSFRSLRSQCVEEISAIEAGLARLRPQGAPMADTAAAQSASPVSEHCSLHQTEIEPVASGEQELVPQQMAAGATSDQTAHGPRLRRRRVSDGLARQGRHVQSRADRELAARRGAGECGRVGRRGARGRPDRTPAAAGVALRVEAICLRHSRACTTLRISASDSADAQSWMKRQA